METPSRGRPRRASGEAGLAAYDQKIDATGVIWPGAFGLMLKRDPDPISGWVLETRIDLRPWIGRQVRIHGDRYDFNGMIVSTIEPIDGLPPPKVPWSPWQVVRMLRWVWGLVRRAGD